MRVRIWLQVHFMVVGSSESRSEISSLRFLGGGLAGDSSTLVLVVFSVVVALSLVLVDSLEFSLFIGVASIRCQTRQWVDSR